MSETLFPRAWAKTAAGVDSIYRAMQEAIEKSNAEAHTNVAAGSTGGRGKPSPPHRHLFALVLAQPQTSYASSNIYTQVGHWDSRSKYFVTFIFPGFARDTLDSFSDKLFNDVLDWLEHAFIDFEWSGLTTVVLFASNPATEEMPEPIDKSAVMFFDIETMQEKNYIKEPRQFFEGIIALAKKYPADDAFWELHNSIVDSATGASVLGSVKSTVSETLKKYIHIPDEEISRAFEVRQFAKVHGS